MTAWDELVREAVSGLEAVDGHSVLMDARQVLKNEGAPAQTRPASVKCPTLDNY